MGRHLNARHLHLEMARLLPGRTTAEWAELFKVAGIPLMPVRDLGQVLDDGHLQDVGFFEPCEHPSEGPIISMKAPVKFSALDARALGPAPRLGEHNGQLQALIDRLSAL